MQYTVRHAVIIISLLGLSGAALAGECRDRLRPLLMSPDPPAAELADAQQLCRQEADGGNPDAVYQLALFHLGLNGRWEPDAAIPLIREAASHGVSEAQYWLAWQYEAGPLLPHDTAVALGWYQRAAQLDHRLALARLAQAYDLGELGLPADTAKAAEYRARHAWCLREDQLRARESQ